MNQHPVPRRSTTSRWFFPRLYSAALVAGAALLLQACSTNVRFDTGAPYQTPLRVEYSALVAFPDAIVEQEYKARVGAFLDRHVFKLPVYEAYRAETLGRLKGFFTGGLAVTTQSVATKLLPEQSAATVSGTEGSELERILAELEAERVDDEASEKTEDELNRELYDAVGLETLRERGADYMLWFDDALFFFEESRIVVSYRVRLLDQRTGAQLLNERYTGRSQRFDPGNNNKTNEIKLQNLTRQAFNGGMSQLLEDLAYVLEARR